MEFEIKYMGKEKVISRKGDMGQFLVTLQKAKIGKKELYSIIVYEGVVPGPQLFLDKTEIRKIAKLSRVI